jgi:F-type H+-transporting ATPase subunit delta
MAENLTLARPYAEAAFQLAKGSNALVAWSDSLSRLAAITNSAEVLESIGNPRMTPNQLTQLCLDVLGDGGAVKATASLTAEQQNFVRVLVDNQRLSVVAEISHLFDQLKHAHEGVKDAEITSAFALDDSTMSALVADLQRKFGCRIQATVKLDPTLIGGVRIAVGDEVIDASVRGKLAAMATALKN